MVLDPISAFGLAANVIQFVEFGTKLVNNSLELYRNKTLLEHVQLREVANQLKSFNDVLEIHLGKFSKLPETDQEASAVWHTATLEDARLQFSLQSILKDACAHCTRCANDLLRAIDNLTVSGQHRKWQSFRHALKSVLGENELVLADQRLSRAQQNVTLFLVFYKSFSQHDKNMIYRADRDLEKNILQAINKSQSHLEVGIQALTQALTKVDPLKIEDFAEEAYKTQNNLLDRVSDDLRFSLPQVARERLLGSLHFSCLNDRQNTITTAHKKTFKWVLETGSLDGIPWDNFPSWLTAESNFNNIYWITGKPGSGKSTLLRFLAESTRTKSLLARWAKEKPILILRCFFWHPGNAMQKSMEGLLRTLLYQALGEHHISDEALQELCPSQWHDCMYSNRLPTWNRSELFALFRNSVTCVLKTSKLVVFIDGLDEFGASRSDREELINILLEMRDVRNSKLCLSSRPWNEFKDSFGGFPALQLEDLTRQDMSNFVEAELGSTKAIQDLAQVAPVEVSQLQAQLVAKSDGVFLWLYLVTKRLKLAAQDGKPLRQLFQILSDIPPDLDDFFKHMLDRIPAGDRFRASAIFQLVACSPSHNLPTLMDLSFVEEETDSDFALSQAIRNETKSEILSRIIAFKRRVNSQCLDLLICGPMGTGGGYHWEATSIAYLHRTVKDFLDTSAARETLEDYTEGPFSISRYFCNAALSQMIFSRKFVTDWAAHTKDRQLRQLIFGGHCLRDIASVDVASAQQMFESFVDLIVPILEEGTLYANDIRNHKDKSVALFGTVIWAYSKAITVIPDPPVCVAFLTQSYQFARVYLNDMTDITDTIPYIFAALGHPLFSPMGSGTSVQAAFESEIMRELCLGIILLLLRHTKSLKQSSIATSLIDSYHRRFSVQDTKAIRDCKDFRRVAEGTLLFIEKTHGITGQKQELSGLQLLIENKIQQNYSSPESNMLLQSLHKVRKSWVTTSSYQPTTQLRISPGTVNAKRSRIESKLRSLFGS